MDDVPTGITPKKKTWNVQQTWERTEPREALLEAFRRRQVDSGNDLGSEREVEGASSPSSPEDVLPTVASIESIPSVTSLPVPATILAGSQIRMKKPTTTNGYSKLDKLDAGIKEERDRDRVVVPLGESGGNIPVPRRRR